MDLCEIFDFRFIGNGSSISTSRLRDMKNHQNESGRSEGKNSYKRIKYERNEARYHWTIRKFAVRIRNTMNFHVLPIISFVFPSPFFSRSLFSSHLISRWFPRFHLSCLYIINIRHCCAVTYKEKTLCASLLHKLFNFRIFLIRCFSLIKVALWLFRLSIAR